MSVPTFHFSLKQAADRAVAKAFAELCISTKRFARNERGQVVWSPAENDWLPIVRHQEFRTVLEDGQVLEITGDQNSDAFFALWTFLNDRRWMLPRTGGVWNPPKPLPTSRTGHEYVQGARVSIARPENLRPPVRGAR
jgi:hypothetical protein